MILNKGDRVRLESEELADMDAGVDLAMVLVATEQALQFARVVEKTIEETPVPAPVPKVKTKRLYCRVCRGWWPEKCSYPDLAYVVEREYDE